MQSQLAAWVGVGLAMVAAASGAEVLDRNLPAGFPSPLIPAENPLSESRIELGRHLFFDVRLSADSTFSCATCHVPAHAFTDGRARAVGVTGQLHPRSAMSLTNVVYNASLNWADPTTLRLEDQMVIPMFSLDPVEMGLAGREKEVLQRIEGEPRYAPLFEAAFPRTPDPVSLENIILAIASFERTLISGNSPYDRYVFWDETEAFGEPARRGMELFFSGELRCSECHSGFNFSGPVVHENDPSPDLDFHNTALYDLDGRGAYPEGNRGIFEHSKVEHDMGRFRAPTLRNVALTAPYMHDGSLATLEEVIAHYAAGGRAAANPLKSTLLAGFSISDSETADLIAFLESLTDASFLHDPRFASPWPTP